MKKYCRFAAGERKGLKSSIWTVVVDKSDIYLCSRLFGSDFKLSLHESGAAHTELRVMPSPTLKTFHIEYWTAYN